ncbi:unnamed protein product [Rotaria sp. Silwood2]|nr:unnamed protein product [Rotaria sp. Silwood2]
MSTAKFSECHYALVKGKNEMLYLIKSDDLITHRKKNQLKTGDDISWGGKSRSERGHGKIVALGTKEQCEATKTVIEQSLLTKESSSNKSITNKSSSSTDSSSANKCLSTIESSPKSQSLSKSKFLSKDKSFLTTKFKSTNKSAPIGKSSSKIKSFSNIESTSTKKSLSTSKSSTTESSSTDDETSNVVLRGIATPTASRAIYSQCTTTSTTIAHLSPSNVSKDVGSLHNSSDSTSSIDTISESRLIIDEGIRDDDNGSTTNTKDASSTSKTNSFFSGYHLIAQFNSTS